MCWDIGRATRITMRGGARSRSGCVHPGVFRPSTSSPRLATTPPATDSPVFFRPRWSLPAVFLAIVLSAPGAFAQQPFPPSAPPPPPGQEPSVTREKQEGYKIRRDVSLVVLHTSVFDERGRFVEELKEDSFRVLEDKVQQKLAVFKREDIPVTMGLVIDNSGSMREKRARVNEAALTLVQTSNPEDEAFVVNFNDDFYLDLDKDFTSSLTDLKEALERIDSRGSTALYDAIIGSLDHAKKGSRDKKVLLVVTDGSDNASRNSLEKTIREIQKTEVVIYTIGLIGEDE